MSREVTTTRTVYTFAELSDAAKDTARQEWSRFLWEDGSMQESMELIWRGKLEEAGWEDLSDLTYSLYSQGGSPMWAGTLPAFEHDGRVYSLTVGLRSLGGSSHAWAIDAEAIDGTDSDTYYGTPEWDAYVARANAVEQAARDMLESLSAELLRDFEAEDDYQVSDEVMAETSEANGYEYDEDGHLV